MSKSENVKIYEEYMQKVITKSKSFMAMIELDLSVLQSGSPNFEKCLAYNRMTSLMDYWRTMRIQQGLNLYAGKWVDQLGGTKQMEEITLDHHPIFEDLEQFAEIPETAESKLKAILDILQDNIKIPVRKTH